MGFVPHSRATRHIKDHRDKEFLLISHSFAVLSAWVEEESLNRLYLDKVLDSEPKLCRHGCEGACGKT